MKSASDESNRMDLLNAAFGKRTEVLEEYRKTMRKIKIKLKSVGEQLNSSMREYCDALEALATASRERREPPPGERAVVQALLDEMTVQRSLMDQHREEMADADRKRVRDLSATDNEINDLGGNLTLPKLPALPKAVGR